MLTEHQTVIAVHWLDLSACPFTPAALAQLTPAELRRWESLGGSGAARPATALRIAVRSLAARELGLHPHEVPLRALLAAEPGGPAAVRVARSGPAALVAIGRDPDAGIDLQSAAARSEALPELLTEQGRAELAGVSDPGERLRIFLRLWSRKEAVAAAAGTERVLAAEPIAFVAGPGGLRAVAPDGRTFHVLDLDVPEPYLAALAASRPVRITLSTFDWRF